MHNRGVAEPGRRADGIVVTPSHNPPRDGGLKYNPPHGGPAGEDVTDVIQAAANRFLESGLDGVAPPASRPGAERHHDAPVRLPCQLCCGARPGRRSQDDPRLEDPPGRSIRWAAPACTTGPRSPSVGGWI